MKFPHKNWLEWTVFAAGLVLLTSTCVYLIVQALTVGHQPAALSVTVGEPWSPVGILPEHFIVPVEVRNDGGRTAAEVDVEVTLLHGGVAVEQRELTFSFVPHKSSRSGALTFERRPRPEELTARVLTYLEP